MKNLGKNNECENCIDNKLKYKRCEDCNKKIISYVSDKCDSCYEKNIAQKLIDQKQ